LTETTPEGRQMISTFNDKGRIAAVEIPGMVSLNYSYDSHGRISSISQGAGRTYTFTYDSHNNLDTVTDALGHTMSYDYDLAGRMTKETLPDLQEINLTYDKNGNSKTVQPPGRPVHQFNYTPVNLQQDYIPPDVGAGTNSTHYIYNLDKQLTKVERPDGKTIDLSYNAATGFLERITAQRGQTDYTYYSGTGYLHTITAPGNETLTFSYDGQLLNQTVFGGTVSGTISRTYDNDFNLSSQTINGTETINYNYDNDGLLTGSNGLTIQRDAQTGLITGTTLGNITDTVSYTDQLDRNNYGELSTYEAKFNATTLFKEVYERDHTGRITKKTETIEGISNIYEYEYYERGWLKQVKKNGTVISSYTYDENGNRLTQTTSKGTTTAIYDNQDRLIQYGTATTLT